MVANVFGYADSLTNPMTALGDSIAGGADGTPARVAGNISTTRKFWRQVGTGSVSEAPVWDTLTAADLPAGAVALTPSGDESGATDAANINATLSYIPATGGVLTLAPGTWYVECGIVSVNRSGIYISAPGCYIYATGAGDVFRMYDSTILTDRSFWGGGLLGMPTIDLVNTTGNSSAFHAGDITQLAVFCQVRNAYAGTASKGVWLDSQWWWTEQAYGRIVAWNCRTGVQFDNSTGDANPNATGSFDRLVMDIFINSNGYGDGVTWAGGAFAINFRLGIYGNFGYSADAVYYVLKLAGSNSQNASYLGGAPGYAPGGGTGVLYIGVEVDGSGTYQPATISFETSPAYTYINGSVGALDFYYGSFAASNNAGGNFQFFGPVTGDATLSAMQGLTNPSNTQTLSANGSTIYNQWFGFVRVVLSASCTGTIMQAGSYDNQALTVRNTDTIYTITFAAAGTSRVADGASDVIAAGREATYHWDAAASLWYRSA